MSRISMKLIAGRQIRRRTTRPDASLLLIKANKGKGK